MRGIASSVGISRKAVKRTLVAYHDVRQGRPDPHFRSSRPSQLDAFDDTIRNWN